MFLVNLELVPLRSQVYHSTTELLGSSHIAEVPINLQAVGSMHISKFLRLKGRLDGMI